MCAITRSRAAATTIEAKNLNEGLAEGRARRAAERFRMRDGTNRSVVSVRHECRMHNSTGGFDDGLRRKSRTGPKPKANGTRRTHLADIIDPAVDRGAVGRGHGRWTSRRGVDVDEIHEHRQHDVGQACGDETPPPNRAPNQAPKGWSDKSSVSSPPLGGKPVGWGRTGPSPAFFVGRPSRRAVRQAQNRQFSGAADAELATVPVPEA